MLLQVSLNNGVYKCTCATFRQLGGTAECLHIRYVKDNLDHLLTLPVPRGPVVPLHGRATAQQDANYYWVANGVSGSTIVHRVVNGWKCGHRSHPQDCDDCAAVRQFLGSMQCNEGGCGCHGEGLAGEHELHDDMAAVGDQADTSTSVAGEGDVDDDNATSSMPWDQRKFQYPRDADMCSKINALRQNGPPKELRSDPPDHPCSCGLSFSDGQSVLVNDSCSVHCYDAPYTVQRPMFAHVCPNGICTALYDGYKDGLFMVTKSTVIAYRYLYEYIDEYQMHGTPVEAYVASVRARYTYVEPVTANFCSANTFRRAYNCFTSRLERAYDFLCPICKDCPDILIGDATAETIRESEYHGTPITLRCGGETLRRHHNRNDRCFCK